MKEKFTLIIETLHADDMGDQANVSNRWPNLINCSFFFSFFFAFLLRAASSVSKNKSKLKLKTP